MSSSAVNATAVTTTSSPDKDASNQQQPPKDFDNLQLTLRQKFGVLGDLWLAIKVSFIPTILSIIRNPTLLFSPSKIKKQIFANVWKHGFGNDVDESKSDLKRELITRNACGVVVDVGSGHGHTLRYLDQSRVNQVIAVEPNEEMWKYIKEEAGKVGISTRILEGGVEGLMEMEQGRVGENSVDTVVCVLTLCSVGSDNLEKCCKILYDVLKPGGTCLVIEHIRSKYKQVVFWQRFWNPIWSFWFDGCKLDVASIDALTAAGPWTSIDIKPMEGAQPTDICGGVFGVFVK
ncbi:hypothetical protein HDU76_000602 [Blyttiomyces sp. JEL0837]|nr:hypothetical protein HDU76_000602 [Blyttiomyces sp. JEL0837]